MDSGYDIDFESQCVTAGVVYDDRQLTDVLRPIQTHSCNVEVIKEDGIIPDLNDTDAIICKRRGVKIGIRTADCVPLILNAPDIHAIAAIHAGWKGSLGGIVTNTINELKDMGADLSLVEAAFGPSICGKCYEISSELSDMFVEEGFADCFVSERHIDLEAVNRKRLISSGVLPHRIHPKKYCTYQNPFLPSWRHSPTDVRILTWIGIESNHSRELIQRKRSSRL